MTKAAGVMGFPVSHSLSPRLHGYWINKYNLDACYVAWEVKPEDLRAYLRDLPAQCAREKTEFRGANLTIPHKEQVLDMIDVLEPAAKAIGAANTIIVGEDGQLIGRNTDGIGFRDSLAEKIDITTFKDGTALVLGAGGAAKAIVYMLKAMGFSRILITNRTRVRAENLAAQGGEICEVIDWEDRTIVLPDVDLVVNTTSLGMHGQPPLEMPLDGLKEDAVVTDIVYVPLETDLLRAARIKGHIAVDGLGMLLHQAKAGFEAWFGVKPDVDEELRLFVLEGLKEK